MLICLLCPRHSFIQALLSAESLSNGRDSPTKITQRYNRRNTYTVKICDKCPTTKKGLLKLKRQRMSLADSES